MQQWEYLFIGLTITGWLANGQDIDPQPQNIYQYLNQLGDQEWELVNVTVAPTTGGSIYAFKRPKLQQEAHIDDAPPSG